MINIPQLSDIRIAIEFYYTKSFLFNADILQLFPGISSARVQRLKRLARDVTKERGGMEFNSRSVITRDAFTAWGLNIEELEKGYSKLKKHGFIQQEP